MTPLKVTADTPVPLILEALNANMGWGILRERIEGVRDAHERALLIAPPETDPRKIQRMLGIMEGLDMVLRAPMRLESDWKTAKKAEEKRQAEQRQRAAYDGILDQ